MIEIAQHGSENGIFQKDIAVNQEISNKYLDHIIHALKVSHLIHKKSKRGGYVLSRKPEQITIYDINNAFEPGICVIECLDTNVHCKREEGCTARGFWSNLNNLIIDYFKGVTLRDLVENRIAIDD